jgi:RimJ/RimL family protein N-acetyltransferase
MKLMKQPPTLETPRLVLRSFTLTDAPDVQRLARDREIAATTLQIPHPYEDGMAEAWIGTHQEQFEQGKLVNFAIVLREEAALVGAVGLRLDPRNTRAELGYWVGKAYWNRGYGTEASRAVLAYGFDELQLHRIFACYFAHNPASGRIMEHLGMKAEGRLRQHVQKWGQFVDLVIYGILRSEFHD